MMFIAGNGHKPALHFLTPPKRVVSLVPSMTESLFDLGLGQAVVGITDYCIHPAQALKDLPRLGGPKDVRVDEILALKPDLVLANWEENTRQVVEALEEHGVSVWVNFPQTVDQAFDVLWKLADLFRSKTAMVRLKTLAVTLDWAKAAAQEEKPQRYFCPIWYGQLDSGDHWWMTFNRQTYPHDLLHILGKQNVFADRERKFPLLADLSMAKAEPADGRDTRYPRISLDEIRRSQPEIILLPDEPYIFDEGHVRLLSELLPDIPAVYQKRIYLFDGSLITWHGTRLAYALRELPALLAGSQV